MKRNFPRIFLALTVLFFAGCATSHNYHDEPNFQSDGKPASWLHPDVSPQDREFYYDSFFHHSSGGDGFDW